MKILGIDPGTATTGYGLIEFLHDSFNVLAFGLIETSKDGAVGERLVKINKEVASLIKNLKPDCLAIEKLFFATNAKTAMGVGQATGVIFYTAARQKVSIFEYAPGRVKKLIADDGRADKKKVQKALRKLLGAKVRSRAHQKTHFDNCADALAVALCHVYTIKKKGGDK